MTTKNTNEVQKVWLEEAVFLCCSSSHSQIPQIQCLGGGWCVPCQETTAPSCHICRLDVLKGSHQGRSAAKWDSQMGERAKS